MRCRVRVARHSLAALVATALSSRLAGAETCDAAERPWIRFTESDSKRTVVALSDILRHVRAELRHKDLSACVSGRGEPIAVVQLIERDPDSVQVDVTVRDSITNKRLSRTLDLRSIPNDARPLALAVGIDELLLASWVEVELEPTTARVEPPKQVTHALDDKMASTKWLEGATAFAYDSYSGGVAFVGIDARVGVWIVSRLVATARLGLRQGFDESAPNGSVRAEGRLAGIGARFAVSERTDRLGLDVLARFDMLHVSFLAEADPEALSHGRSATSWVAWGGLAGRMQATQALRFAIECAAGTPLVPVTATDTGASVTAISGLAVTVGGELAILF